jgi:MFS family permease
MLRPQARPGTPAGRLYAGPVPVLAQRLAALREVPARRPAVAAFAGVFSATLLGFLAIGAVLPVLPRYVRGPVGAGDVAVGVVVGAFAATAFVGRPIGGRLADRHGRRVVVLAGLLVCAVAGALLFLPFGVPGLVVARLVIGLGDGWVFTAGVTWIVDLAPADRRGQAIGMFGLAIWGGLTLGSVLGEAAFALGGYDAVWAFAALSPLAGALLARTLPEGRRAPAEADDEEMRGRLLPRAALRPGVALALANVGYGTMSGFVVLHLDEQGIGHGAATFTAFAGAVVASRLVLGRLPDRLGPRPSALGAAVAQAAGLALVAVAGSWPAALAGALVMGTGTSLIFPSLALLVVRRVGDARRGAAMGAFTAFFDAGVGLGAPLAGAVAAVSDYRTAFLLAAALAFAGGVTGSLRRRPAAVRPAPA